MRNNIKSALLSSLILLTSIIAVSSAKGWAYYSDSSPYNFSYNYVKFESTNQLRVEFSEVVDVEQDDKITLLSEYTGKNYMGLYDPSFYFYNQKMIECVGSARYFSYQDYKNKTKTAIYVKDSDIFVGFSAMQSIRTPLIDKCIFNINTLSDLYKDNIDYIINQTSLDFLGDVVYIDSSDKKVIENVGKKLENKGYTKIEPEEEHLTVTLLQGCLSNFRGSVVLIPALLSYILFLFSCIMYFVNNRRILSIHMLCGGTRRKVLCSIGKEFFVLNACFGIVMLLGASFIYREKLLVYFTLADCIKLYTFHICMTTFCYYLGYNINLKVQSIRKENTNVK